MNIWSIFSGDAVHVAVALALLLMSVSAWVVILWKSWLLPRVRSDVARSVAAFWQAPSFEDALVRVSALDREEMVLPMVQATRIDCVGTLAGTGDRSQQLTRLLRDCVHAALRRLQAGQVLLATVGATAPFVGLLGTVWGIYHALLGISGTSQISIDKISGPVGEALTMTAAGLGVAIPAVIAFNVLGRWIGQVETELEGFAYDLRDLVASPSSPSTPRE